MSGAVALRIALLIGGLVVRLTHPLSPLVAAIAVIYVVGNRLVSSSMTTVVQPFDTSSGS